MIKKLITIFKTKDLRKKLLIVFLLLLVFRLLTIIPMPGVSADKLKEFLGQNQILGLFNIFTGGAFSKMSIALLGVSPYITSSIILQLLTMVFPALKEMFHEDGEEGRRKFENWTRWITIPLAFLQAFGMLKLFQFQKVISINSVWDWASNIVILTATSMIIVWLGELITEQKMGNGISMIIFAGIVSAMPLELINTFLTYKSAGWLQITLVISYFIVLLGTIVAVVYVTEGERRVPVSYAKHVRGNKMYGGSTTNLPMKVNQAGVIPIIFAMSILMLPSFIGQMLLTAQGTFLVSVGSFLTNMFKNQWIYGSIYFLLVFLFTFFYTSITFEPHELANNLQKMGGFIPGYRPGEKTAEFLQKLSTRITLFGAIFLGFIAILPLIMEKATKVTTFSMGGTSVLILVAVAIEINREVDAQITMREYDY